MGTFVCVIFFSFLLFEKAITHANQQPASHPMQQVSTYSSKLLLSRAVILHLGVSLHLAGLIPDLETKGSTSVPQRSLTTLRNPATSGPRQTHALCCI